MTVTATDYDDPRTDNARLEYSIVINKEIGGEPVFRIVPSNGKIYAMVISSFFISLINKIIKHSISSLVHLQ